MKRIDIRISEETKQKLEELARVERRSMTEEIVYLIEKRFQEVVMVNVLEAKKEIKSSTECYNCDECVYNTHDEENGKLPCGQYRCYHACEIASKWDVSAFDV